MINISLNYNPIKEAPFLELIATAPEEILQLLTIFPVSQWKTDESIKVSYKINEPNRLILSSRFRNIDFIIYVKTILEHFAKYLDEINLKSENYQTMLQIIRQIHEINENSEQLNQSLLQTNIVGMNDPGEINRILADNTSKNEIHRELIKNLLINKPQLSSDLDKVNNEPMLKQLLSQYHAYVFANIDLHMNYAMNLAEKCNLRINFLCNKDKLNFILKNSIPATKSNVETILLNPETSVRKFILKEHNNLPKGIKRIALYARNNTKSEDASNNTIIKITYTDGEKKLLNIDNTILSLGEFEKIFINQGAIIDFANNRRGKMPLSSKDWENLNIYKENDVKQDYVKIHQKIAEKMARFFVNNEPPFEILFIGCGQGNEIKEVLEYLKKNNYQFVIYGIDQDKQNIATAEQQFQGEPIFFKAGSAQELDKHIQELRHRGGAIQAKTSIAIASGFLTRQVVSPKDAFEIFKEIASLFDNIFISGRTETLITRRDARSSGMIPVMNELFESANKAQRTFDHFSFVDLFTKMKQIIHDLSLQKNALKVINLNDYTRPALLLSMLDQQGIFQHEPIKIYLQNATIHSETMNIIADLINKNECDISIIVTGKERWYAPLMSMVSEPLKTKIHILPSGYFNPIPNESGERAKISLNMEQLAKTHINRLH